MREQLSVRINLLEEEEHILPGSRVPMHIEISSNASDAAVSFDEIRIRVKEVQAWYALTASQCGNNNKITEINKLAKRNVLHFTTKKEQQGRQVITLDKLSLDISHTAARTQEKGLVLVHHILQVKLVSRKKSVQNMEFEFPLVIGGNQYCCTDKSRRRIPSDHPVNFAKDQRSSGGGVAAAIANSMGYMSTILDSWLEAPIVKKSVIRPKMKKQARTFERNSLMTQ